METLTEAERVYWLNGARDALLLDCTLPSGLDPELVPLADELRVPVILMSGYPDMAERVPGAGVSRPCIEKPFSLDALLTVVESVVPPDGDPDVAILVPRRATDWRPE